MPEAQRPSQAAVGDVPTRDVTRRRAILRLLLAAATLLALCTTLGGVIAQSSPGFGLRRWLLRGGGGRTGGGQVSLQGAIGQPLAGRSAGGGWTLHTGFFWPLATVQPTAATTPGASPTAATTPAASPTAATPIATQTPASASMWTVNSTDDREVGACDAAHCSLREAIHAANGHAGPDTVRFAVPASDPGCDAGGVCTLRLSAQLPALADGGTILDGYSQTGARPNSAPLE